ncbi:MAG: tRNA1(Val) (adenine(37)-N6)-methyltransferase [Oscillospiraceae bacterium]
MEHRESLCGGRFSLYYDDALFKPGTDSFLLGAFARPKKGDRVCDLGAGTGLLGLLLFARQPELTLFSVELLPQALTLAEKSFAESGLSDRCRFYPGDLRRRETLPEAGSMDYVVCNPPYYPQDAGLAAQGDALRAARTEEGCSLDDVAEAAKYLLRWGGRFALVHRAERLMDVLGTLRAHALEPKRLRMVQHSISTAPSLVLVEAVRGGRSGLTAEPALLLRNGDGSETAELRRIYFKEEAGL